MKKPTILVIQQKWPPELMNKAGLAGEMMISSMMAVGCVGMLSNGPSRDVDAIRTTLQQTAGVFGLHELRTRRMAHQVLVDAHVQVRRNA